MYSAAAEQIYAHFLKHSADAPGAATIEALIDAAFWASLRREEGFIPKISLAYVGPHSIARPLKFGSALPLSSRPLTRLAPAVERPGIHLGVWPENGALKVWGATRNLPPLSLVVEVVAPGLLVVKHSRAEDSGKFVNVAVLSGEEIQLIDQNAATLPDCPALLTNLLGLESQFSSPDSVNVLIQLAVSMRAHGRGGSLLVVPSGSETWRESVLHPITYSVEPPFEVLRDLMDEDPAERGRRKWQDALRRAVDGIGGLTAVDGATVITQEYRLLAFGAKIIRRPGHRQIGTLILTEPVEGVDPLVVEPARVGGTRHLSAAQFASDQKDAIALVASQDGRFTVFAWSPCENMVHAHRIEALLL
jgi:hypothetical protein